MVMATQVRVQLIAVTTVAAYSAIATFVLLKLVNLLTPLRVDSEAENVGLDLSLHDERGYDL